MTTPDDRSRATRGRRRRTVTLLLAAAVAAAAALAAVALLVNVFERKQEARNPFFRVVELDETTDDPAVWGQNFPLQYDGYRRTVDMVETRFGGSEAVPREPTPGDPRTVTSQSKLDELPGLKRMWAGYAFSVDFREERGHAYMLEDQTLTGRQQASPQAGTCVHCHASVWVPYRELGDGDLIAGFEKMNKMPYAEAREHVEHPVSCIDCHDPVTMALRVTRPGFLEGITAYKAAHGEPGYEVNRDASRQEMRTYVCGQCHVEYYFQGEGKRLTYPWTEGLKADEIYAYYEKTGFSDWTHAETGAPMLKAQHPEFEMWSEGTHGRAGVACADCHMPYRRVGALKVSDHHVRSPLLDVAASCQPCHKVAEEELLARAERIQSRTAGLRDTALAALVELIDDLAAARAAGATDAALDPARAFQRQASFYLDFVEAENSAGFHADQASARVLAQAIEAVRQGQRALPRSATAGP